MLSYVFAVPYLQPGSPNRVRLTQKPRRIHETHQDR